MSELIRLGMELDPSGLVRGADAGTTALDELQVATEATNVSVVELAKQFATGLVQGISQGVEAEMAFIEATAALTAAQEAAAASAQMLVEAQAAVMAAEGGASAGGEAAAKAAADLAVAQGLAATSAAELLAAETAVGAILATDAAAAVATSAALAQLAAAEGVAAAATADMTKAQGEVAAVMASSTASSEAKAAALTRLTAAQEANTASATQLLAAEEAVGRASSTASSEAKAAALTRLTAAQEAATAADLAWIAAEEALATDAAAAVGYVEARAVATAELAAAQEVASASATHLLAAEEALAAVLASDTEAALAATAAMETLAVAEAQAAAMATKLAAGLGAAGKSLMGGVSKFFGGTGMLAGLVGGAALVKVLKDITTSAAEVQKSEAKLAAILRATGYAAGFTAKQLNEYSQTLQNTFLTTDEDAKDAIALMATFRRVQGQTFKDGMEIALDMAEVMGTDVKQSIIQVGKALNDPILGVTALRRVGVQLTTQQMAQVKAMMAVNDIAGAQKVILQELTGEFGGAGKAAATGLSGAIHRADVAYADFIKSIGTSATVNPTLVWLFEEFEKFWKVRQLANPFEEAQIQIDDFQTRVEEIRRTLKMDEEQGGRLLSDKGRQKYKDDIATYEKGIALLQKRNAAVLAQTALDDDAAAAAGVRAAADAAAADAATLREEAAQALADVLLKSRAAIDTEIAAIKLEGEIYGMAATEAALYIAAKRGATEAQLAELRVLLESNDARTVAADEAARVNAEMEALVQHLNDVTQAATDETVAFIDGVDAQEKTHAAQLEVTASRDKDRDAQVRALKALWAINDALAVQQKRLAGVSEELILQFVARQKIAHQMELETLAAEDAADQADKWAEAWTQAVRNIQDELATLIGDTLQGMDSIEQFAKGVIKTIQKLIAQMAAAELIKGIGNLASGIGGGLPAAPDMVPFDPSMLPAPVMHSGGVVGAPATMRSLDPAVFRGALRMHEGGVAGLKPDEVPAILQKGEEVVPKGGRQGDSSNLNLTQDVNFNIAALDSKSVEMMLRKHRGVVLDLVLGGVRDSTQFRNQLFSR